MVVKRILVTEDKEVAAAAITRGPVKPIVIALKRRESRGVREQVRPDDLNGQLIELLIY